MSEVGVPVGGYSTEIFKGDFDLKLLCNTCNKVLRDPVQSYCGHRFCRECISDVVSSGNQVQCKSCIEEGVDNEDFSIIRKEQLFPDNALRREMFSLEANCPNQGCSWAGKFRAYEKHVKECKYMPVLCPNCGESVEVNKMKTHLESTCPKRQVKCKYCSLEITQDQMEDHTKDCPKYPLKCETCGKKKIPREMMQEHIDNECPNQKISCLAGCDAVERRRFINHIEEKPGLHIQELMNRLDKVKNLVSNEEISRLRRELDQLKQVVSTSDQQVGVNGPSVENVAQSSNENQNITRITALEIKVRTFEGIATTLHKETERILNVLDENKKEIEDVKRVSEEKTQKIKELERKLANSEVQVIQLTQKVLACGVTSINGELIWRLENWKERQAQALAGEVTSIFSPPFYTSQYGYKMCVRIYPNGDGMGKNTHVSIFFAIMKGEYDPILDWPFSRRVVFMVFDQDGNNHIKDSFRTDPNSSSFKRPTTDMNIASGCPLFLPLSRLKGNNGFVKDNVMYIKTKVEEIR
ncbi:TNF receptor-associated factor 2-like [Saccostrea echinata]|uniref:TNF receptor-associated factor 2-like n=1 Tax=Saccostrea echinata TaxID=191078 RepID=UPI002A7ED65A|nr:TNF receptor-associated factor 2-like [Saccostrea echinata]